MSGFGSNSCEVTTANNSPTTTHRTEAASPNTRKLFCRSAAVLGRPHRSEVLNWKPSNAEAQLTTLMGAAEDGRLRQKSFRVLGEGTTDRWGRPSTAALRQRFST